MPDSVELLAPSPGCTARALQPSAVRGCVVTKIEAVIQPSRLEPLKKAIAAWGVDGLTVTEVKGYGRQKGHGEVFRGAEYSLAFRPKLKVEMVVPTSLVPRLLDVVRQAVGTGRIGDGKLFVIPVDEAIRVRTGERGDGVL
jgi:nitrogen regulatory protein P-II 1